MGPYILDFYCPSEKLCIEIDGAHHNTEEQQQHDIARNAFLTTQGIRVLRVPNQIVWTQSDVVASAIMNEINSQADSKEKSNE